MFVAALGLRPQLLAIGPVLPLMREDLGMSHAAASLLVAIPLISMGIFALPAGWILRRMTVRRAVASCLTALVGFSLIRPVAPNAEVLLLATVGVGVGIGLGGAMLPVFVKDRFASRPAFASGLMANGFQVGAGVAGAAIAPLAVALGGWREALFVISVLAVPLPWIWLRLARTQPLSVSPVSSSPVSLNRLLLVLILAFALRSVVFQCLAAWLPTVYIERGWSEASAGFLAAVLIATTVPATIATSVTADRIGTRQQYLIWSSVLLLAAIAGFVLAPAHAFVWTVMAGAGIGVLFPLGMALPLDVADGPKQAARTTSIVLGGGYTLAAAGPVGMGLIRDATGSFVPALVGLMVMAVLLVASSVWLTPTRLQSMRSQAIVEIT